MCLHPPERMLPSYCEILRAKIALKHRHSLALLPRKLSYQKSQRPLDYPAGQLWVTQEFRTTQARVTSGL
jgi:hypothetical protein